MVSDAQIEQQLPFVLDETHFDWLGERYVGKVRDNYTRADVRYLITTDRLSCFDRVVTTVPFKGQVLNQLAATWFSKTAHIVPNHVIDVPDANVLVSRRCDVLPVEVVMRGYLTGSAWRDYEVGRPVSGIVLPAGLKASQKLPEVLLTPSTKAAHGSHDTPISERALIEGGLVAKKLWEEVREVAFALFRYGQQEARARGLLLVDTKYEFGLNKGELLLVDEIHTLDSSRYWVADTYEARFMRGEAPEMLDKEPTRQWLLSQGFKGDGAIPTFENAHRVAIARHYIDAFERVLGRPFVGQVGNCGARIEAALRGVVPG